VRFLTETESRRVAEAVAAAEMRTGGEIATAIIPESDDYGYQELLFALIVGAIAWTVTLATQAPLTVLMDRLFWSWQPWMLAALQGAIAMEVGLVAYWLAQVPAVDRLIVSRARMAEAVARRARRHFVEAAVYGTVDRTGILLFVSVLERRVELIADRGINEQVQPETWSSIVAELTAGIRAGKTANALVAAVEACGNVLDGRVARRRDDTNELPNRPTQLEKGS
jgi:putative membrane protein